MGGRNGGMGNVKERKKKDFKRMEEGKGGQRGIYRGEI